MAGGARGMSLVETKSLCCILLADMVHMAWVGCGVERSVPQMIAALLHSKKDIKHPHLQLHLFLVQIRLASQSLRSLSFRNCAV